MSLGSRTGRTSGEEWQESSNKKKMRQPRSPSHELPRFVERVAGGQGCSRFGDFERQDLTPQTNGDPTPNNEHAQ